MCDTSQRSNNFLLFSSKNIGLENKENVLFLEQRGHVHTHTPHTHRIRLPYLSCCCKLISYVLPIIRQGGKHAQSFILVRAHSEIQSAKNDKCSERCKTKEQLRIIDTSLSLKGIYAKELRSHNTLKFLTWQKANTYTGNVLQLAKFLNIANDVE